MATVKESKGTIDISQPQKVGYCIPIFLRDLQINEAIKAVKDRIQPHYEDRAEPIAVVCYGPSLNDTWEEIKKFKYIMTCSGAHRFLIERGVVPTWHCDLDPREHKVKVLGTPHKDVEYLMASTCHPKMWEHLKGYNVKLWHIFDGTEDAQRTLPAGEWSLFGGSSVGLRALALARFLGFKDLHVFGMDGCLQHNTKITTEDGIKTIKWVVDNKYSGKVLSLDNANKFVWSRVVGHRSRPNHPIKKPWVSLLGASGGGRWKLTCTEDHPCAIIDNPFRPQIRYIAAVEACEKFLVRRPRNIKAHNETSLYNLEQISVLIGTFLGDGSVDSNGCFRIVHGPAQAEYMSFLQKILGGRLDTIISGKNALAPGVKSSRLTLDTNAQTKFLRKAYINGVKSISSLIPYIDTVALAFWYMDDGSLSKDKGNGRDGAALHTQGFSDADQIILKKLFMSKWGIETIITTNSDGNSYLRFNVDSASKLFSLVAPFIPSSMQYKLPASYRISTTYSFDTKRLDYAAGLVNSVRKEPDDSYHQSRLYDLEIEGTHNFVANGCVVHNSESDKYGKHAAEHPNQPKDHQLCEYNGKTFKTTASMAECSRQTPREIDQLGDVTATFYGEGLTQEIMKDHKKKPLLKGTPTIGFVKPELISPEYLELNKQLHKDNLMYGVSGSKYVENVRKMLEANPNLKSVGDYGSGKGLLAKGLNIPIWEYDPCIPGKEEPLRPVDLCVCTNVLEHIEPDKLNFVLDDLKRCVKQVGYFVIDTKAAQKKYADGRNAHLIVQGESWWRKQLEKHFTVGSIQNVQSLLHVIVGPKTIDLKTPKDEITKIGDVKFYTPNSTTKWRAKTLLTKEPITVEWINSMQTGEVLFDIGANVGGYTVLAGSRGVKVYAFEPEAENYALLTRNISLNKIDAKAYCLAFNSETKFGVLNLSQEGVGGSCHVFGEPQEKSIKQGCISFRLDDLISSGLSKPDHIKIDVDGLEPEVIKGASNTLKNVKSLLVEVNTNSKEHLETVKYLQSIGFNYDQDQVDKATRKEGAFKGCAEFLFKKNNNPYIKANHSVCLSLVNGSSYLNRLDSHFWTKLDKAEVVKEPTPHIFIENIFSENVYQEILENLPNNYVTIEKIRHVKGYKERLVSIPDNSFWTEFNADLQYGTLKNFLLSKFGIIDDNFTDETLLIRDLTGYKIGPHTDSTAKVISALFYLPKDESQIEAGTSLYTPKDKDFKCIGGPHYSFDKFDKVLTLPFKPNSLFAFLKTDTSFHGVELYTGSKPRDVLLYDIRRTEKK